jgi:hypothetical protein
VENTLTLKNVRISMMQALWKKQSFKDSAPAFSAHLILSADDPQVDAIEDMVTKVAEASWGAKSKPLLAAARAKDKIPLHNGDSKAEYDGYAGNYFISARAKTKPLVVDRDKSQLEEDAGRPYPGCYVDASIEIYAYDSDGVKGLTAGLRWVQFRRDGDAFAGGAPASIDEIDEIEELSVADDEAPLV